MKTRKSVKTKDSMCPSQKDVRFLERLKRSTNACFCLFDLTLPMSIMRNLKLETRNVSRDQLRLRVVLFLRDTKADQRRARRKIPPREKGEMWRSSRFAFLAWGVPSRSRFARPTIPEEKWGLLDV